jgi:TonB-dependent receptor
LSRPDYYWISPWTRLDISNATIDRGNPLLVETKIWNYNLSAYLYNNVTGFFSVSGFYKELKDIFYRKRSIVYKPEDIIALGIPGREGGYQMTSYENADRSEVKGIEVEWQTQLAYYPGMPQILKGFVFNINYARIWSKTYFPFDKYTATLIPGSRPPRYTYAYQNSEREGPMPGQADHIANISVGYDIDKLSTRVSWTYQGSSISAVGEIAETDTWNKAFWRWDALVKYRFTDWVNLSFSLVNMSNQPDQSYYGAETYPTNEFYYGMTGSASIEITL